MKLSKFFLIPFTAAIFTGHVNIAVSDTKISGFLTAGASYSDNAIPYLARGVSDDQPNYEQDTVLGIQLDSQLDELSRFSAQFIASSATGDFNTNAEWLYYARDMGKHTTARIGRLRLPLYMNSQQLFVGASYPWIRPPQEVYNLVVGLSRFTGADVTFNLGMDIGALDLQFFTGKVNDTLPVAGLEANVATDQLVGVVGKFSTENLTTHLSYARLDAKIDVIITEISSDAEIATFGIKYSLGDFDLSGEASERMSDDIGDTSAWYGSLAYHMGSWTPYIVLAQIDSGAVDPSSSLASLILATGQPIQTLQRDADSITLGIRKTLSPRVSLNAELHSGEAKHGTKGLFRDYVQSTTSSTTELQDPEVNMVSVAVNVIF